MESATKESGVLSMIEKLLVIQDRDRKIRQLTRESEDIPARKKLTDARLDEHRKAVQQGQEELKKNASAAKQIEIDIDSMKAKILKLREQQGQVKRNEEYRAIEHEIAMLQDNIRKQEDGEIELMEQAETIRQRIAQLDAKLKQEEAIVKTDESALDQRLKNIQSELAQIKADRDGLVADVDPDWLSRYDRTFKHTGDFAVVPIESGSCGGCHMKLPPQVVQNVKRNQTMVCCSFCSRILYWRA
jgi:predicted  nucleic acid-binding Zn-ribbon protein